MESRPHDIYAFLPGDGHSHHIAQEIIVMYYNITSYNVSMVNLPFNAGRNKNNTTPTVTRKCNHKKRKWMVAATRTPPNMTVLCVAYSHIKSPQLYWIHSAISMHVCTFFHLKLRSMIATPIYYIPTASQTITKEQKPITLPNYRTTTKEFRPKWS